MTQEQIDRIMSMSQSELDDLESVLAAAQERRRLKAGASTQPKSIHTHCLGCGSKLQGDHCPSCQG